MNSALYKQYDSRWGNKPYPTSGSSFSGNGCGCCACTHIVIEQDKYKNYTPENLRPWMIDQGFAYYNQGTTWEGIRLTLEHYGYKVTHIGISDPMSKAWTELNKGNRIGVILFKGGAAPNGTVWTAGGHYVAFTDYYVGKDGLHYFYTKDSGGRDHDSVKYGYYSYENSMKGLVYQMWIVEKINTKPTPTPTPTPPKPTPTPTPKGKYTGEYPVVKKYLEKGDRGTEVTKLQNYLNWYTSGEFFKKCGNADGVYGNNTLTYVKKMQSDFFGASEADGLVGPKTIAKMKEVGNGGKTPTPTPTPAPTPSGTKIKGMDISTWQGKRSVADFQKAKAEGIQFVILRVGFTGTESRKPTLDNCFENNYANAKAAGLKIGYYYYTTATSDAMAQQEAEFTLANIKGKQCDYPVYFDVEDPQYQSKLSSSTLASLCNKFCNIVNAAGYTAGVYASTSWFNSKIGTITAPHTKWVAQYYKECQYKGAYDMWQYTSSETVAGMGNNIDMNWCYKNFTPAKTKTTTTTTTTKTTTTTAKTTTTKTATTTTTKATSKNPYTGQYPVVKKYLEKGDRGTEVTKLQNYLNWYTDGEFFKKCGGADGVYGKNTLTYTKRMQTAFFGASEADGKVGPKTIAKMKAYSDSFKPKPTPTPTPTPTPSKGSYTGSYPTAAEIKTASNAGIYRGIDIWCKQIANSGKYHYVSFNDDEYTHKCPICTGRNYDLGWNCIGFAFASWRHGGRIPSTCNCGVIWNGLGDKYYNWSDTAVLADMKSRIGVNDIRLIRNNNNAIPASMLQRGDLLMFYNGPTYAHMGVYVGNGKYSDSANPSDGIGYGKSYASINSQIPCKFAIRYTGSRTYLSLNDMGDAVTKLQKYIDWYFDGAFFKECGGADGVFGSNTEKWVKKMQTKLFSAAEADGCVGPKTIEKMKTVKK